MGKLKEMLKKATEVMGIDYMVIVGNIRLYVKTLPDAEYRKEIDEIDDLDQLRVLWNVGVRQPLYSYVLKRMHELARRVT